MKVTYCEKQLGGIGRVESSRNSVSLPRVIQSALPEGVVFRRVEIGEHGLAVGRPFGDEARRRTEQRVDADVARKPFDPLRQ